MKELTDQYLILDQFLSHNHKFPSSTPRKSYEQEEIAKTELIKKGLECNYKLTHHNKEQKCVGNVSQAHIPTFC